MADKERAELLDQLVVAVKALRRSAYQYTPTLGVGATTYVNVNRCRICGNMSVGSLLVAHRPTCTVTAVSDLLQKLKELDIAEKESASVS